MQETKRYLLGSEKAQVLRKGNEKKERAMCKGVILDDTWVIFWQFLKISAWPQN